MQTWPAQNPAVLNHARAVSHTCSGHCRRACRLRRLRVLFWGARQDRGWRCFLGYVEALETELEAVWLPLQRSFLSSAPALRQALLVLLLP